MPKPLKDEINPVSIGTLASAITQVHPGFAGTEFVAAAAHGLNPLELKQRVAHVAASLARFLPQSFPQAADVLRRAAARTALDLWSGWPANNYVADHGLHHPDDALHTLAALTSHASAEFAIRAFLTAHPDRTLTQMHTWAASSDVHLRRLASEGSRPRLPWATRVPQLADPELTIPLLDRLRNDPEVYVRRSVANHLNDIAHDHPAIAILTGLRWADEGGKHTDTVLRHGLRGLIRRGNLDAFALINARPDIPARITGLRPARNSTPAGQPLTFSFDLHLNPRQAARERLILHYALTPALSDADSPRLHFLSQSAPQAPLRRSIERSHPTQSLRPGNYRLTILANGTPHAHAPCTITG
jgi:3-methyladenine DNA glycosylase AlkC